MRCSRCSGNVYVDKVTVEGTRFDIACIMCGERKFLDAKTSKFAAKLYKKYSLDLEHTSVFSLHELWLFRQQAIYELNKRLASNVV